MYLTTGLHEAEEGIGQVRAGRLYELLDLNDVVARCSAALTRSAVEGWGKITSHQRHRLECLLSKVRAAAQLGKDRMFYLDTSRRPPIIKWAKVGDFLTHPLSFGPDLPAEKIFKNLVELDRGIFTARDYVNRSVIFTEGAGEAALTPGVKQAFQFLKKHEKDKDHIYYCHKG